MNKDKELLFNYIPEAAVQPMVEWLHKNKVQLKITRARSTKLGDFRVARNGDSPRISVNYNLNPYSFLITLVHEMAHAEVFKTTSRFKRIQPHGIEWQLAFSRLMQPFLNDSVFPKSLLPLLNNYFQKPKASSFSDSKLMQALKMYNAETSKKPQLNDLVLGDCFLLNQIPYRVEKKMRTRFQCKNLQNKRLYIIHGLAEVEKISE
ncbi:MAG: hypothetical protein JW857_10555 [Bacteroidales bacterium]|nr:hypothetical protein [Bacteroidales bacterium]